MFSKNYHRGRCNNVHLENERIPLKSTWQTCAGVSYHHLYVGQTNFNCWNIQMEEISYLRNVLTSQITYIIDKMNIELCVLPTSKFCPFLWTVYIGIHANKMTDPFGLWDFWRNKSEKSIDEGSVYLKIPYSLLSFLILHPHKQDTKMW